MKFSPVCLAVLLFFLVPLALGVTNVYARRHAEAQMRREDEANSRRSRFALSTCRQVQTAALMYANDHKGCFPAAERWEEALKPYLNEGVSAELPPAADGTLRRLAMNSALSGVSLDKIEAPAEAVLFFETASTGPNTAGEVETIPDGKDGQNFVVGWSDGHCYSQSAGNREFIIQRSRLALAPPAKR